MRRTSSIAAIRVVQAPRFRRHACALAAVLLATGCAYRGELRPDLFVSDSGASPPIQAVVEMDSRPRQPLYVAGDIGSFEVQLDPALSNGLRSLLARHFKEVNEESGQSKDATAFARLGCAITETRRGSSTATFLISVRLELIRRQDNALLGSYPYEQSVLYDTPGSTTVLAFLTGLTFFILSPITFPAIVQLQGNHGVALLEQGLARAFEDLDYQIARDASRLSTLLAIDSAAARSAESTAGQSLYGPESGNVASRASVGPSKYDALLDAVVVVVSTEGQGSGFLITKDGYAVTNAHVVGGDAGVSVRLRDGSVRLADVKARDSNRDLALIKLSGRDYPCLVLGQAEDTSIGLDVLAIGAPRGLDWSMSRGIVSAARSEGGVLLLQTDAAINPGSSGGPLIDAQTGVVIGVSTLFLLRSEGLGFAVASREILLAFPDLSQTIGRVDK